MGFSRQESWSGLPFPSPGHLPDPGVNLCLCVPCIGFFAPAPPGKPRCSSWVASTVHWLFLPSPPFCLSSSNEFCFDIVFFNSEISTQFYFASSIFFLLKLSIFSSPIMFLIACWIILWWQLETFVGSFWHPCHLSVLHWLSFLIQAEVFLVLGMTSEFEYLGHCILRFWMLSKFYVLGGLFWQRQMGCSSIPADGSGSSRSWLSFCWCPGKGLLITAGWREFWPPVVCTDTTLAERGRVPHCCFLHGLALHCGAKEEDLITPQLWLISCLSTRPHRRPQWRGQGMPCYHLLCSLHVRLPTGTAGVMPPPLLAGMKVLLSCCLTQPSGHHFDTGFGLRLEI